jgi:hypothetical protein
LQYPRKVTGDELNSVRHVASRHFRNKEREYLKENINELATSSDNKTLQICIEE